MVNSKVMPIPRHAMIRWKHLLDNSGDRSDLGVSCNCVEPFLAPPYILGVRFAIFQVPLSVSTVEVWCLLPRRNFVQGIIVIAAKAVKKIAVFILQSH